MAKKLGKLFTLAVTAGTAAAAAYYYLQNKKAAVQEAPEEEDDFEKDPEDDFDDTDFTDDDFVDESEHPEEAKEEAKEDTPVFSSETKEDGRTYVTLQVQRVYHRWQRGRRLRPARQELPPLRHPDAGGRPRHPFRDLPWFLRRQGA